MLINNVYVDVTDKVSQDFYSNASIVYMYGYYVTCVPEKFYYLDAISV